MNCRALIVPTMSLAWIGSIGVGQSWLMRYEWTPGSPGDPPMTWLAQEESPDAERRAAASYRLLAFLHPHCPCSRATIDELAQLIKRSPVRLQVDAYFCDYELFSEPCDQSANWRQARVSGIHVHIDPEGRKARKFGCSTSGHALLYRPDGSLAFSGGITAGRGVAGDNSSVGKLLARLTNSRLDSPATAPVFGCPIHSDHSSEQKGE